MAGPLRAGIVGAASYTGGELLRLLAAHPDVRVTSVTSSTYPGEPVSVAHPHLAGLSALTFTGKLEARDLDVVFLAGGHGQSADEAATLLAEGPENLRLIDLSGDFRLLDASLYPAWYGKAHPHPALLPSFVYGLTELDREAIARSRRIANPGCFATAIALALGPLAKSGLAGTVHVTAVTGSSGSGAQAKATTHHPTRDGSMLAYKPLRHQHVPEVEQLLGNLAGVTGVAAPLKLSLVPVSGPLVRGIYAACQFVLPSGWNLARVQDLFRETYEGCFFVRIRPEPPALNQVTGSNFCDLHLAVEDGVLSVISAIDNLVKGASGQAIQNLNVMLGIPEEAGLTQAPAYP